MSTHREKRFVAPLPLLPFNRSSVRDYRVLSACNLNPISRVALMRLMVNSQLGLCIKRLLERGHLLEHNLDTSSRQYIGYTLTCAGEIWMDRFFTEHGAALSVLGRSGV